MEIESNSVLQGYYRNFWSGEKRESGEILLLSLNLHNINNIVVKVNIAGGQRHDLELPTKAFSEEVETTMERDEQRKSTPHLTKFSSRYGHLLKEFFVLEYIADTVPEQIDQPNETATSVEECIKAQDEEADNEPKCISRTIPTSPIGNTRGQRTRHRAWVESLFIPEPITDILSETEEPVKEQPQGRPASVRKSTTRA